MKRIFAFGLFVALLTAAPSVENVVYGQFGFFSGEKNRIEAEPNKEYYLTDSAGHWFIMAKKFSGDEARKQANRLAYELRKRYKVPAYIYKYDPDQDDLAGLTKRIGSSMVRSYRYQTSPMPEFAVLVGSFPSVDDPGLQKAMLTIKRSRPDSLKNDPLSQKMMIEFEFLAKKNKEYAGYGPLGGAMAVPNPLLPKDFFHPKGVVDKFLEKINSDSPYSLLNNPKMFTVRVATFAGTDLKQKEGEGVKDISTKLQDAGIKAAALCDALRKKGIEAWEFHDRNSSFVTIGSFDSYGQSNPDGTTEMNPEIYKIIEKYRGTIPNEDGAYKAFAVKIIVDNPKAKGFNTNEKRIEMTIPFDLQPYVIMVPQRPGNAGKIRQAQERLEREQEEAERHRLQETLAIENEKHARRYAQAAAPDAQTAPQTGQTPYQPQQQAASQTAYQPQQQAVPQTAYQPQQQAVPQTAYQPQQQAVPQTPYQPQTQSAQTRPRSTDRNFLPQQPVRTASGVLSAPTY